MKKVFSIVISLLLVIAMLPEMAFADTANTYDFTLTGSIGNTFDVKGITFDPDNQFKADNSTFDIDLAIASLVISMNNMSGSELKDALIKVGFDESSIRAYDYDRTGKEEYMTGYTYATREIKRNGKPCTLLMVAVNSMSTDNGTDTTSGWKSILPDLDFLNHEMDKKTGLTTDYNSSKALTFTKAAEQVLNGSSNVAAGENVDAIVKKLSQDSKKDYLVWVVGQSRGGAIGNYLSKLLIDKYGKNHVVSYLFSVPNVDKDAKNQKAADYNTIFNIVNPDDVVTYVPFGTEGGNGWGYTRWGVDVNLGCIATADQKTTDKQSELFSQFAANAAQTKTFVSDGKYYGYSKEEGNGVAVKELVAAVAAAIPNPEEYYESTVTYSSDGTQGINILNYLVDVKNKKESLLNVLMKVQSAATSNSDLTPFANFAIRHVLGYSDVNAATSEIMKNMMNIKFVEHEAYLAHTPENYLSWLMAEKENAASVTKTVNATKVTAKAVQTKTSGKKVIKVTWTKKGSVTLDAYQVYRSTKSSSGFKKIATTKSGTVLKYSDSKSLKKGTKYYYKVRGMKTVAGAPVYTKWSNTVNVKFS